MLRSPLLSLTIFASLAASTLADEFILKPEGIPARFEVNGKLERTLEASGVEPVDGERLVLVAHDKEVSVLRTPPSLTLLRKRAKLEAGFTGPSDSAGLNATSGDAE